ncbi:formate/nitrite transporter family protein [Sphingomonas sp. PB2P19]|uniref:formate/nitrite transporter family protein n=1 Tax=Sphingomonas rhamnosi TaxID=3096156 RepID=UPI002FCBD192
MADQSTPSPPKDDVDALKSADAKTLHQAVREAGEDELDRPTSSLFFSGLAAGLAISSSLIAEGALHAALPDASWREVVVAIGYPIGFLIVILGRMQLFTESTISAMLPLITKPSGRALRRTLRLWGVVIAANLIGTAIAAGAIAAGLLGGNALRAAMLDVSMALTEHSAGGTLVNAIPAGFLIAILAWSLPNARSQAFQVIFAIAYVVAIGGFSHSIVGSAEAFLLLFAGKIGLAQAVGGIVLPAIVGNLVGGAGVFALLAHAQVRGEMKEGQE